MATLVNGPHKFYGYELSVSFLPIYSIFVISMSRLPQISTNFRASSAGVQSLLTLLNAFLGSSAKTFISFREVKDPLLAGGALITSGLNLILLIQVMLLKSYERKNDDASTETKLQKRGETINDKVGDNSKTNSVRRRPKKTQQKY